jgi:hypothetical protein
MLTKPPTHPLSPVIPSNACHLCLTAAAGTELAVASFGIAQLQDLFDPFACLNPTVVYTPKGFVPHAASLRHAFAHCGIFVAAALRGGPGSVSVPMWLVVLSDQLPVLALVSRYLTNKLIGRGPRPDQ